MVGAGRSRPLAVFYLGILPTPGPRPRRRIDRDDLLSDVHASAEGGTRSADEFGIRSSDCGSESEPQSAAVAPRAGFSPSRSYAPRTTVRNPPCRTTVRIPNVGTPNSFRVPALPRSELRQHPRNRLVVGRLDRSQVEHDAVALDARDDRRIELVAASLRGRRRRAAGARSPPAASATVVPGALPPPIVETPSTTSARQPARREHAPRAPRRARRSRRRSSPPSARTGTVVGGAAGDVLHERRFERGVGHLVDAQRAHQRVLADACRRSVARPTMMPGLRPAEQLVAAEAARRPRPPRRSPAPIGSSRRRGGAGGAPTIAAAEILDDRDVEASRRARRARRASARSVKPSIRKFDGCTRRMSAGALADRRRVVGRRASGSSCRPRAARAPDCAITSGTRKPPPISTSSPRETITSRPRRERGQHEHRRRRVVVDDDRGLGAGEAAEQRLGVGVARAAPARRRGRIRGSCSPRPTSAMRATAERGERRAAEIRVDDRRRSR